MERRLGHGQGESHLAYFFPPKIGWPTSSVSRCRYLLFSWQMYSVSSPVAFRGMFHLTLNGFVPRIVDQRFIIERPLGPRVLLDDMQHVGVGSPK